MQTSPESTTSDTCARFLNTLACGKRRKAETYYRVNEEEHVERPAEEHAEQPIFERRPARHRIEGRHGHDGDQRGWEERVAEEARVVGVVRRLGEGACDRGHVEGDLDVLERLADVLELLWPLNADAADAAGDLPRTPTQRIMHVKCA